MGARLRNSNILPFAASLHRILEPGGKLHRPSESAKCPSPRPGRRRAFAYLTFTYPAFTYPVFASIVLTLALTACAHRSKSSTPSAEVPAAQRPSSLSESGDREYNDQDANAELWMEDAPRERIRSRPRSTQHRSMPLHGAEAAPCGFDDCSISDEDNPLP